MAGFIIIISQILVRGSVVILPAQVCTSYME